jgi:GTP-binding protein HflX
MNKSNDRNSADETELMPSVILVGLHLEDSREAGSEKSRLKFERSMKELGALAEAAGLRVRDTYTQNADAVNAGTFIGAGKLTEIRAYIDMCDSDGVPVDAVIFNETLSPIQLRNLSNAFDLPVMDRTALILNIFSERAMTREARLQVEYARLQYMLPRLQGLHRELGRQGGGSGATSNKGAGEKKIELDRRHIEQRSAELRRELEAVDRERATQRQKRISSGISRVSLVGYTNAGKSTILNEMLDLYGADEEKKVLEKDMLFATLDTTVRRIDPGSQRPFLLSDTVGFVSELPTSLIKAFRSTLEDAAYADMLLIVTDLSDPDCASQMQVTIDTLKEIGAGGVPRIFVFNKSDITGAEALPHLDGMSSDDGIITISAKNKKDIMRLTDLIECKLGEMRIECDMLIPYSDGSALGPLKEDGCLEVREYTETGTMVHVTVRKELYEKYRKYVTK